ncbi:hypothetical protein E4T47_07709 [Aureobasidium subglaciale]|nr:hypothetical protein E4T43_08082 [Aureobasidium subglaciale]KAI5268691.1 hypothetical protein E4T47_07709 [Aureobasidium subglaciale]
MAGKIVTFTKTITSKQPAHQLLLPEGTSQFAQLFDEFVPIRVVERNLSLPPGVMSTWSVRGPCGGIMITTEANSPQPPAG